MKNTRILFAVFVLCIFVSQPSRAYEKDEPNLKSFKDSDFLFRWSYDFSEEGFTILRGTAKNIDGFRFESVYLTITGLDGEGNRLNAGFGLLDDLDYNESDDFEIRIRREGREKSFLFAQLLWKCGPQLRSPAFRFLGEFPVFA